MRAEEGDIKRRKGEKEGRREGRRRKRRRMREEKVEGDKGE